MGYVEEAMVGMAGMDAGGVGYVKEEMVWMEALWGEPHTTWWYRSLY